MFIFIYKQVIEVTFNLLNKDLNSVTVIVMSVYAQLLLSLTEMLGALIVIIRTLRDVISI